uniref:Uncharacterized protein n=1 Tax=viral metagenome TaxID=1070528 RepID=A0A6C0ICP0_9ZZZZ
MDIFFFLLRAKKIFFFYYFTKYSQNNTLGMEKLTTKGSTRSILLHHYLT